MNRTIGTTLLLMTVALAASAGESGGAFVLKSSVLGPNGALPEEFTGDGAGVTPPLEWSGAPAGTKSFALIMNHSDPEGRLKFYWTLYNIAPTVTRLEKNSTGVGTAGLNTIKDRVGYAPPHSKGPGLKTYTLTMYALSDAPKLSGPASSVSGPILTAALKDITLSKAELKVTYDRTGKTDSSASAQGRGPEKDGPKRDGPPQGDPRDDTQRPKRNDTQAAIRDTAISAEGKSTDGTPTPEQAQAFLAFYGKVKLGFDKDFLYVRTEALPEHRMMVGITAWQQQVPIAQSYMGDNAWRIPLKPVEAKNPLSAKDHFFRGAIALAANGIPIFNPIKNDGKTDTFTAGELDEFGGHCGRADDYHYHIAPLHLEKLVGPGKPIAYALDGYPIYGLNEPDGSPAKNLDVFNGHKDAKGHYHYHSTKTYPYLNGGFHGEVTEKGGQVDPQPSGQPMRGAGTPLRGATITDFTNENMKKFTLTYRVNGQNRTIRYSLEDDGSYTFLFTEADGTTKTEVYKKGQRNPGGGEGRASRADGPGQPRGDGERPPRGEGRGAPREDGPPPPRQDGPPPPRNDDTPPKPSAQNDGNETVGETRAPSGPGAQGGGGTGKGKPDNKGLIKPTMADTIKVNVYADNWFVMYINGKLRAVDPIEFTPHNVVSVDILPEYPMTIAIMAKDNADPKTGLEYGDHIGDGGFIIKFADGTVSNATWKAKNFFKGPLNSDTKNPKVEHTPIPDKWWAVDFDDSKWANATEFTEERVKPKEPFYQADFKGAKFIWTEDLDLDNTVIFRTKVEKLGWKPRWNTKPDLDITEAPFK